jgi:aspartyl-tRNA(Asn)/glutamyl-tRNA(Gln) amidotransferase subunit A
MSPADLPLPEAARALRQGALSARDLIATHLDRIARRDGDVRAFVHLDREAALAAASAADAALAAGTDLGPLHGIPFAVKDLIDVAGMPTRCGSRASPTGPAAAHAAVVTRLVAAGAVPFGKVATYEYALTGPSFDGPTPPPRNPWSAGHATGGSSSGAAAAVAAGLVRVALGTDTGGSVRSPAAWCGVVGLKPSRGLLPMAGVVPLSPGLDHLGVLAASVPEAASVLDALAPETGAAGALGLGVAGLSVGYARDWVADDPAASPAVVRALDDAAAALSMAGARIVPVGMPDYALSEAAGAVILHAEALKVHTVLASRWQDYGRQARQSLSAGVGLTPQDMARAWRQGHRIAGEIDAILARHDVILTATTLTAAPALPSPPAEETAWSPMRTLPFNLTGHPAISVPMGFDGGLPLGLQIIGRRGDEASVCRVGAAFEAATGHGAARPYLPA